MKMTIIMITMTILRTLSVVIRVNAKTYSDDNQDSGGDGDVGDDYDDDIDDDYNDDVENAAADDDGDCDDDGGDDDMLNIYTAKQSSSSTGLFVSDELNRSLNTGF